MLLGAHLGGAIDQRDEAARAARMIRPRERDAIVAALDRVARLPGHLILVIARGEKIRDLGAQRPDQRRREAIEREAGIVKRPIGRPEDRESVVKGERWSVQLCLGGRRYVKKKK